jgi:hypothetical protein
MEPGPYRDGRAEFARVIGRVSSQLVDGGETGRDAAVVRGPSLSFQVAIMRECFILDPASPSGARWALPQTCGRNKTRATPGSPPGRRTAKGYFPISLTLGGRKRFLRVHRTVLRIDRAGLSRKVRNGPIPLSAAARRTPLGMPVWPVASQARLEAFAPGRNLPLGGRSGHARDEMTGGSSFGSNRGALGDGGCSIMFCMVAKPSDANGTWKTALWVGSPTVLFGLPIN